MSAKRKVYWDACVFIGLINQEPERIDATMKVWREAEIGETEIWTSALSIAEVFKFKCDGTPQSIIASHDEDMVDVFRQPFVFPVTLDPRIARDARHLLRRHPKCKKPTDAIHLASACAYNVHEMHTWDKSDLLALNDEIRRADGNKLRICEPYELITTKPEAPLPEPAAQPSIFDDL